MTVGSHRTDKKTARPLDAGTSSREIRQDLAKQDRTFTGVGGTLTLTADGVLYGAGWDLSLPYGVDYDPAAARAAEPVKIAQGVISAAAGYNHGLYVTEDGQLHFIGSSSLPYPERFAFDGVIREVFAAPDRDVFRLVDDRGDAWVWGNNLAGELESWKAIPRAVLDDQTITPRWGKAIWRFRERGEERRCQGMLLEVCPWEILGEIRRQVSETDVCRRLSATYGENNLLFKYIKRAESPKREVRSPNWSEAEYEGTEKRGFPVPQRPGITDQRVEAFCCTERETTYTVGIYSVNQYLFTPIRC